MLSGKFSVSIYAIINFPDCIFQGVDPFYLGFQIYGQRFVK